MPELDVSVATYRSRVEAEIARSKLAASQIDARLEADNVGGAYPSLEGAGVHVAVHESNAEEARRILSVSEEVGDAVRGDLSEAESLLIANRSPELSLIGPPLVRAVLLLSIGAVCGFLLSESEVLESRSNVLMYAGATEVDQNRDGRVDAWFVYGTQFVNRTRYDRNFDGQPDYWEFYRGGLIFRSEVDENFDGQVDAWHTYEFGNVSTSTFDFDSNNVPDLTMEYQHGSPVLSRLHPNGGPDEREERFVDGMVREVYSVSPDGERALVRTYDQQGRESHVER